MTDELIKALEKADGPDRELDAAIARAAGFGYVAQEWHYEKLQWYAWWAPERRGRWEVLKNYTASIDAALTLVPEGWAMRIKQTTKYDQSSWTGDGRLPDWVVSLTPDENRHDEFFDYVGGQASTLALALCIAALRVGDAHLESEGMVVVSAALTEEPK